MRIIKNKTLGLVIDIQERLFPAMWEKDRFLHRCLILLKGLNVLNVPLVVTQQYTKGLGETIGGIKSVIPGFSSLEKRDFSCCGDPDFNHVIQKSGAENIVICGIESHVCVLQTAIDLKEQGLNPVIVADCITSRSETDLKFALERFRHENIMMATCESILFELTKTSKAVEFKTISALVK